MRLFLVRHGQSMGNVNPAIHAEMADHAIPLSPRGWEQAQLAGRRLSSHLEATFGSPEALGPIRLWVSPYRRTRQTAAAIEGEAATWIRDRREHVLLCEQQFGLFDGVPDEELPTRFPDEWAHYDKLCRFEGKFWARIPLGESRFDVATRVAQSFGTFHRDATGEGIKNLIVICHGVTLRAFVMMWCGLTPEWFEAESNPGNCAIRLIEDGVDRGYLFDGYPKDDG